MLQLTLFIKYTINIWIGNKLSLYFVIKLTEKYNKTQFVYINIYYKLINLD